MTAQEPPGPPSQGTDPSQPVTTSTRQPSWLLIGGVIAAIAAIALVWFFLLGPGAGEPTPSPSLSPSEAASEDPSPEATPSPTPDPTDAPTPTLTPEPSAEAGPIEVTWTAATGIEPTAMIETVAFLDGRWIAVGGATDDFLTAAIWTSDDGASWTRAEIDSTQGPDEYTNVVGVTEIDGALVAFGSWGIVPSDQRSWMTWRSTDGGATWTESREGPEGGALGAIANRGPGLVGAGWNYAGTTPFDSYIVTSADGITWERTAGTLADGQVLDIGVIGDRLVAVGHVWLATGATDAAAWYSDDDGDTWTAVDMPDGGSSLSVVDFVPHGDGLAAIGNGGRADVALFVSAAWLTTDGETWEIFDVATVATATALGAVDGGLVAVGNFAAQDLGPGVAWTSTDAETWVEGAQLGDGSVRLSAAAGNSDVVVAGGQCQSSDCETVIWIGEVSH